MRMVFKSILAAATVGLIAVAVSACGTTSSSLTPSASTTTLMLGWEQKFTLDWTAEPESGGTHRLRGYVVSQYGQSAEPLRLLGQALDTSGAVVGQRLVWVPNGVAGFGRSYFEIPHLPSAERYRVAVWDYTLQNGESNQR